MVSKGSRGNRNSAGSLWEMAGQPNLFTGFNVGVPKPWKASYRGIEYNGELLLAEAWQPALGTEVTGEDVHFRIVVFTKHQKIPSESISDRRIALCLPARPSKQISYLTGQYLAIKEKREGYKTRDTQALQVQESELTNKLLAEQTRSYQAGRIHTKGELAIDPKEVFSTTDNEKGFSLIASVLLADAYTALPIDTSSFRKTLTSQAVSQVFDGFFKQKANPEARTALENFAVGLRLAKPENPYRFAPGDCPVFNILTTRLEQHNGNLALQSVYSELRNLYGLTKPLISLYLLCFVCYAKPAVELHLKPDHGIILRSGKRPLQDRLTPATAAEVWWRTELEQGFDSLRYTPKSLWNLALAYTSLINEDLKETDDLAEISHQEALLIKKLEELGTALVEAKANLKLLAAGLGAPLEETILNCLERLSNIAQSKGYPESYTTAQKEYKKPGDLAEDIALYRRLRQVLNISSEVLAAKSYLDQVVLRESDGELALDGMSILEQLELKNLVANPHLWPSLKALFDWFRSRYRTPYQSHHREYNQEMASLRLVLDDSKPELDALRRLNSIAELGKPIGEELLTEYQRLLDRAKPCPEAALSLDTQPTCPSCGLLLTATPPTGEVEQFLSQLHRALKQQQRRLSAEAISQVLAQSKESRLDQFIKVLQTSQLSPLVNVLDDELVDFLRTLLAEAHTYTQSCSVLTQMGEKFPALEDVQIDEAASYFAALLKSAFEEAKRKNPGKRIRLILE